jgi:hypothetical protein
MIIGARCLCRRGSMAAIHSSESSYRMDAPPQDAWKPWSPDDLFHRLRGAGDDWYVVGGWALDLWHDEQTRWHDDLEFSVLAAETEHYRRTLSGLEFFAAQDGQLRHLPMSEPLPSDVWQQWGADLDEGCWRVDMMVDRGSLDLWVYKRDATLVLPRKDVIRESTKGIRYLAPSMVLLFKAKHARDKDCYDFRNALPRLDASDKADLRGWLNALHPDHDWIAALA